MAKQSSLFLTIFGTSLAPEILSVLADMISVEHLKTFVKTLQLHALMGGHHSFGVGFFVDNVQVY